MTRLATVGAGPIGGEEYRVEADDLIAENRLGPAIDRLRVVLRALPGDAKSRVSLMTLHGLSGDWTRVGRQLDALESTVGPSAAGIDVERCRGLVAAEVVRKAVLGGEGKPRTFGEPARSEVWTLDAWLLAIRGEGEGARALLEGIYDGQAPLRGHLGNEPFEGFHDADDLLAPVLEVFTEEGYFWVAWERVIFLDVAPPRSLLDLLWAPARLVLADGLIGRVVLPGMYPGSATHPDEAVRLGHRNDWTEAGAGLVRGAGPKVYDVGGQVKALIELQDLSFGPATGVGPGAPA